MVHSTYDGFLCTGATLSLFQLKPTVLTSVDSNDILYSIQYALHYLLPKYSTILMSVDSNDILYSIVCTFYCQMQIILYSTDVSNSNDILYSIQYKFKEYFVA
jgi:hypothetical protein